MINTHFHWDHWQGNEVYATANPGLEIVATRKTRENLTKPDAGRGGIPFIEQQIKTLPTEIEKLKSDIGDERGSANHMKPETVLRAARLIRTGEVIELGHVLGLSMPLVGTRRFDVHTKRTFMNQPVNRRGSNEELVVSEIGQVGTQLDGFAHQTHENSMYNCFKVEDISTRGGFTKLGIEKVGALFTRGVLIDVAALKGVDILPDTYEIIVQDLQQPRRDVRGSAPKLDGVLAGEVRGKHPELRLGNGPDAPRRLRLSPGALTSGRSAQ